MSQVKRPALRTFGRLTLETLEAREVPAAYWWSPVYSEFSTDPRNWVKGPTAPWDRYQVSDPAPGPSDHLYFLGGLSNNNCTIPQPSYTVDGQAFAGIHLLFGPISLGTGVGTPGVPLPPPPPPVAYTGTVTAAGSFTVGTLEVECGNIKQADPATVEDEEAPFAGTLTVKTTFDWTGGTLNSGDVAGTIALAPGATGVAEPSFTNPGINGTVTLGSTLELRGTDAVAPLPNLGSTLSMIGGTFNVVRGQIIAGAFSNLFLIADEKADPLKGTIKLQKPADGTLNSYFLEVKPKGTATVTTSREANSSDTPGEASLVDEKSDGLVKNNGTVVINNRSKLILKAKPNSTFSGGAYRQETLPPAPQAPDNPSPITRLETDSAIQCTGDLGTIVFASGTLEVPRRMIGDTPSAVNEAVLAAGEVWLQEAASVNMPGEYFNTLRVEGTFTYEGEFRAALSHTTDNCDRIFATGKVVVNENRAMLSLRWGNSGQSAADAKWPVIQSQSDQIDKLPRDNLTILAGGASLEVVNSVDDKIIHVRKRNYA